MNYVVLELLGREQSDKNFARAQVNIAIKAGRLKSEPCICGKTKVEGHHADYKRPLDVIWMCRKHHAQLHVEQRRRQDQVTINPFKMHKYRT